ncbi:hypothetical protein Tco_0979943, partial [Tanacetum coccineum]
MLQWKSQAKEKTYPKKQGDVSKRVERDLKPFNAQDNCCDTCTIRDLSNGNNQFTAKKTMKGKGEQSVIYVERGDMFSGIVKIRRGLLRADPKEDCSLVKGLEDLKWDRNEIHDYVDEEYISWNGSLYALK